MQWLNRKFTISFQVYLQFWFHRTTYLFMTGGGQFVYYHLYYIVDLFTFLWYWTPYHSQTSKSRMNNYSDLFQDPERSERYCPLYLLVLLWYRVYTTNWKITPLIFDVESVIQQKYKPAFFLSFVFLIKLLKIYIFDKLT